MTLSYVVSGFAVGLLVGLTGVGGGSLMTPLLTLLFGIHPSVAVGTDLAFAAATKTAGTVAHRFKGTVRWDIVRRLCLGALPAAACRATLAPRRPQQCLYLSPLPQGQRSFLPVFIGRSTGIAIAGPSQVYSIAAAGGSPDQRAKPGSIATIRRHGR